MIFIINEKGKVITQDIEPVYQGSHNSSKIMVLSPLINSSLTVAFDLPNGDRSRTYLLNLQGQEIDYQGQSCCVWLYSLPREITRFAGQVKAQFCFYNGTATVENEQLQVTGSLITTSIISFTVQQGVVAVDDVQETEINNALEELRLLTVTVITNEPIRELNEAERISNENERQENEQSRVSAESLRENAIDEIRAVAKNSLDIAKQANFAKGFENYLALVEELLDSDNETFNVGQSFLIQTLNVPDVWVYSVAETPTTYKYTTDQDFINTLKTVGYIQIGYYKVAMLETLKQDLTNYAIKPTTNTTIDNPITHNKRYRLGNITNLTLNAPSTIVEEFTSELMFTTGATINLTTNGITFKGRDCDQFGNFDIQPNTNYYISFMKFGSNLIGLVAKM